MIYSKFNDAVRNEGYSVEWKDDSRIMKQKGQVSDWSWPNSKYYYGICLGELRKITKPCDSEAYMRSRFKLGTSVIRSSSAKRPAANFLSSFRFITTQNVWVDLLKHVAVPTYTYTWQFHVSNNLTVLKDFLFICPLRQQTVGQINTRNSLGYLRCPTKKLTASGRRREGVLSQVNYNLNLRTSCAVPTMSVALLQNILHN